MPTLRKFGIELEMVAPAGHNALNHARAVVTSTGIEMRENSHFGRDYHMWQAKPDGSIQPYDRGAEIVSRILPGEESSFDEIRRVVTALETAGFGVNRTCGFHVHLNVADLPVHVRQLIILRYAMLQADINAMVPPSRRGNTYCPALPDRDRDALRNAVDTGSNAFPQADHFAAASMQWIMASGQGARIEFRQAAATCNAAKVIGWVRFLQEMVDEVARRAATITFGRASTSTVVLPRPVLTPRLVGGRVPNMRNGSDADRALTQLCTYGVITAQWAVVNGIGENVLRRIIVGFRRHGAGLITSRHDNGVAYVLAGSHTLPVPRERVFADAVVQPTIEAPPPPIAAPQPARTLARDFVAYPFEAGLSAETLSWCSDRRDTFASSDEPAAVRAA